MHFIFWIGWGLNLTLFFWFLAKRPFLNTETRNVILVSAIYLGITLPVWEFASPGQLIQGLMILPFLPLTAMLAENIFKSIKN